jgi:branched-chain amino acid transport system substrate-binding protein
MRYLIVFLFLIALVTGCTQTTQIDSTLDLAVLVPLTGDSAQWGNNYRDGINLMLDDLNLTQKIRVHYEDTVCSPEKAVSAYIKLTSTKKFDIVTTLCSGDSKAIESLVKENNQTLVTVSSHPDLRYVGDHVFNILPLNDVQALFIADYFLGNNLTQISIVYENSEYGVGIEQSFSKYFEQNGGVILGKHAVNTNALDYGSIIIKLSEDKPQAVFLASYSRVAANVLKRAKENEYNATFVGTLTTYDNTAIEIAKESIDGFLYAKPVVSKNQVEESYRTRHAEVYDNNGKILGPYGHDLVMLLALALDSDSSIRENLELAEFQGASGHIKFDGEGNVIGRYEIANVTYSATN